MDNADIKFTVLWVPKCTLKLSSQWLLVFGISSPSEKVCGANVMSATRDLHKPGRLTVPSWPTLGHLVNKSSTIK
jgi:hypothetical protein